MKSFKQTILIFVIILAAGGLILYWLWQNYQARKSEVLTGELNNITSQYTTISNNYYLISKTLYDEVINLPEINNSLSLGSSLIKKFEPVFNRLKAKNFQQLAFYNSNGTNLVNMYKPEKSGDTGQASRVSIQRACMNGEYVEGFEEGEFFNGFRYLFPLKEENKDLGCVETAVSFSAFQNEMAEKFSGVYSFILKKNVFSDSSFTDDNRIFTVSDLNNKYFIENDNQKLKQAPSIAEDVIVEINKKIKEVVKVKIDQNIAFVTTVNINGLDYIISFLPIRNIAGVQSAYLIGYNRVESLYQLKEDFYFRIIFVTALLLVMLFLFYYIYDSQQKLLDVGDKLKNITSAMNEGLLVIDKDKNIVFFNPAAEVITGFKVDEVIGKQYNKALKFVFEAEAKPNNAFINNVFVKLQTIVNSKDLYLLKNNGERMPIFASAAPLLNGKTIVGCIVVFRDATQEREVDKAKTEFVSLASHQLKTPLSAINWYTEMLTDGDVGVLNERQKDFVNEIIKGNSRMVKLINSLLNVSRIDMGTLSIIPENVDLKELVESTIDEQKFALEAKHQKLIKNFDSKLPKINLDPSLMRIVIQNVYSNAIKYTREEGEIKVGLIKENDNIKITIADNGYGIPKNQQAQIFKKLFRADNVKSKKVEGTGLGLYVAKAVIEAFGGRIWFESEENKGTTFYITLPIAGAKKKEGSKGLEKNT